MNFSLVLTNWNFTLVCFLEHLKAMKSDFKTKNLGSNLDGQIAIKLDQHHSPEKFFHVYSEGRMGVTRKVLFFKHSITTSRGGRRHSTEIAFLLHTQRTRVWFLAFGKIYFDVAEIYWRCWSEESERWFENVDQTHLVQARGKPVLQKSILIL